MELSHPILIFLTISVAVVNSDGDGPIKCMGKEVKNDDLGFGKNWKACYAEFDAFPKDKPHKRGMTCLQYCALKKDGIFDAAGKYMADKANATIDKVLPADLATKMKDDAATCIHAVLAAKPDYKEEETDYNCCNHRCLVDCVMSAWKKTCVEKYNHDVLGEDCLNHKH